jgi:S2P endopeptidase
MSLASFAYGLSIFWLIIHALQRLLRYRKDDIILPSHRPGFRNYDRAHKWHVTIRFLQARIETSRWNEIHDRLSARLKKKGCLRFRIWLERFYNVGFASGVTGMVVAFGLLIWTTWALWKPFSIHKMSNMPTATGGLVKRGVELKTTLYEEFAPESPITPIVRFNFQCFWIEIEITSIAPRSYRTTKSYTAHFRSAFLKSGRP